MNRRDLLNSTAAATVAGTASTAAITPVTTLGGTGLMKAADVKASPPASPATPATPTIAPYEGDPWEVVQVIRPTYPPASECFGAGRPIYGDSPVAIYSARVGRVLGTPNGFAATILSPHALNIEPDDHLRWGTLILVPAMPPYKANCSSGMSWTVECDAHDWRRLD